MNWYDNCGGMQVLSYLRDENEYCARETKHLEPLQKILFDEILSHLKETDDDVIGLIYWLILIEARLIQNRIFAASISAWPVRVLFQNCSRTVLQNTLQTCAWWPRNGAQSPPSHCWCIEVCCWWWISILYYCSRFTDIGSMDILQNKVLLDENEIAKGFDYSVVSLMYE